MLTPPSRRVCKLFETSKSAIQVWFLEVNCGWTIGQFANLIADPFKSSQFTSGGPPSSYGDPIYPRSGTLYLLDRMLWHGMYALCVIRNYINAPDRVLKIQRVKQTYAFTAKTVFFKCCPYYLLDPLLLTVSLYTFIWKY